MPFKLVFCAASPDKFVIKDDKKLKGLEFLTTAGTLLRRVVDECVAQEHRTLPNRQYYCVAIPSRVAADSEKYDNTDTFYVMVSNNYLKNYVFYSADFQCARNQSSFPFAYKDRVVITSHVDELALVQKWIDLGYPATINVSSDGSDTDAEYPTDPDTGATGISGIPVVQEASDVKNPKDGYTVFDIIEDASNLNTNNQ